MRIFIHSPGNRTIRLALPTRLLFNNVTALIGASMFRTQLANSGIKAADLRKLVRELHRMRKKHPGLMLVEVEQSGGDTVRIRL